MTTGASGWSLQQAGDLGPRQRDPRRRVRIGQDDRAGRPAIVGHADLHGLIERHCLMRDTEQAAIDRVETVGDVREQQRRIMLQESGEGVGQHLVRAIADEHLFRPHVVVGGQRSPQRGRLRVRVQAQRIGRLVAQRCQCARGGTKRTLIGVELDQLRHAGLFARHIGLQVVGQAAPETAHFFSCES